MKTSSYLMPEPDAFDPDARPNSILMLRPPAPEPRPQPQRGGGPDYSPVLISARLHHPEIALSFLGKNWSYTLHDFNGRASRLAAGALVLVRLCAANPRHAEVYEPGLVQHRFLGHAIAT